MSSDSGKKKRDFENKLNLYIKENGLLKKGDRVLVALSGGSDSVCLLKALCNLQKEFDISLVAAHVNHMIRGDEADRDEEFVKNLCRQSDIELEVLKKDVPYIARAEKKSLELAAREVRYAFFENLCNIKSIDKIATAHNKNDNAETIVMNFMRGSGLTGLGGIDCTRGNIIRPLLCMDKEEILSYLSENNSEYITDSTNLVCDYTRNRVRLEMIEYIKEHFNPNFINTIANSADIIREEDEYLDIEAEKLKSEYIKIQNGQVFVEFEKLKGLHRALRWRIIRKAVAIALGGISDIGFDAVKRIDNLKNGKTDVGFGMQAHLSYGRLCFETDRFEEYEYEISCPGKVVIAECGGEIECSIIKKEEIKKEKNCVYFDYDKLNELKIRNRRDGDIIKTDAGRKKLKKLFTDEKIPVFVRNRMPLIVSGENVLWVCGVRRCDEFKVMPDTDRVIKIKYNTVGE